MTGLVARLRRWLAPRLCQRCGDTWTAPEPAAACPTCAYAPATTSPMATNRRRCASESPSQAESVTARLR